MDTNGIGAMHKAKLVDLLHQTQRVMQGFTRTALLVSVTITSEDLDGAELTRQAAQKIAEMLLKEAAEKREAGAEGEAEIRERAVDHFKMLIHETLRPVSQQQ